MRKYTEDQKKAVLDLFEQGLSKREISEKMGLSYQLVLSMTPRMRSRYYLSDKALKILTRLNEAGYYLPKKSGEYNTIRGLKNLAPIHFVRFRAKRIVYMRGHEIEAMKVFLERYRFNYLNPHELAAIRDVFGLRVERYDYKPYRKKKRSEEARNARLDEF